MTTPHVAANRSLYRRLLWTSLASIVLVWLLLLGWFVWEVTRVNSGYFDRDLRALADGLATLHGVDIPKPERAHVIRRQIEQFSRAYSEFALGEDELAYRISDAGGRVLAQTGGWPPLDPGAGEAPVDDGRWRAVAAVSDNRAMLAQVAIARSFMDRALAEILVFFLLPLLVALPLIMLMLKAGFGRALSPLTELATAIAGRDPASVQPLACRDAGYRELRPVFDALNALLARLATYRESEQRFFADAAHELRTPLAATAAQVHVLAQATTDEERSAIAASLDDSITRSADLIGKLLTLSRLDAESAQLWVAPLDLAALARAAVARHAPRAVALGLELSCDGVDSLPCQGDRDALESLLDNLIDNAMRYCPTGTSISVEATPGHGVVRLAVNDDGPGIAPEWRDRVLARFVRLPATTASGSGLGLAIVKRVVDLHGGTLLLGDGLQGRGLGVEIRLPGRGR